MTANMNMHMKTREPFSIPPPLAYEVCASSSPPLLPFIETGLSGCESPSLDGGVRGSGLVGSTKIKQTTKINELTSFDFNQQKPNQLFQNTAKHIISGLTMTGPLTIYD